MIQSNHMIDWFFYLLGITFFTEFLHELYHFSLCSPIAMVTGVLFQDNQWFVGGKTICTQSSGEVIPTLLQILLFILLVIYKLKK